MSAFTDRLDELETLMPEGLPHEQRVSVPAGDLRSLVALVPVARAAASWLEARVDDEATSRWLAAATQAAKGRV